MRPLSRWSVIVPTIRPDKFVEFLDSWQWLFEKHSVDVLAVVDAPSCEPFAETVRGRTIRMWASDGLPDFIPRRSDMCRSWAIYQAWRNGAEFTLSLDDDVRPEGDVFEAYEEVFDSGAVCSDYLDVGALTSYPGQLRGFPFRDRVKSEVAVQYGGWHGVLDFDAPTQLATNPGRHRFADVVLPVPRGAAVTGCIMNCAWRTEFAPIMWQLPLLDGKYNRFGDIWSGLFQKRVLDALGKVMVINGKASVLHERASDPIANLERETPGIRLNEEIWSAYGGANWGSLIDTYRLVTNGARAYFANRGEEEYAKHFALARDEWLALFA